MSEMIQQGLKSNQNSDIIDDNVVLGTREDLLNEYRWLLARVQRIAQLLNLPPVMTGKKQRQEQDR